MRIIGGKLKGKVIYPPEKFSARPTTDFAKEGIFNTLENIYDFSEMSVLDLFSGTGSIAYEFSSRGCTDVTCVEMSSLHHKFIKNSAAKLNLQGFQVIHLNVFDFLKLCKINYDIIFADPPYDLIGLDSLPNKIIDSNILKENGLFVFEHSSKYSFKNHPRFYKEKSYGSVHFSLFK